MEESAVEPSAGETSFVVTGPGPITTAPRRRPPKVAEVVARDLAAYIVDSKLQASTRLPPEKEMAEQLGVGRATLREALRLLESQGVVTIRSGPLGGPIVRRPDAMDLASAISLTAQFEDARLEQVVEARVLVESAAARLAAMRITPEQIARLKEINAEMRRHVDDNEETFELNRMFHLDVANASGNVLLGLLISALFAMYHRGMQHLDFHIEPSELAVEHHDRVIEALETGDGALIEKALREHAESGWECRQALYPNIGQRKVRWEV